MKKHHLFLIVSIVCIISLPACDSGPKVIESESPSDESNIPAFQNIPSANNQGMEEHKVVVNEVLNTDKYTYLNVTEKGQQFWIAVQKRDAKVGETYHYRGGLLKNNFYSQEFDRVFETVYLVSEIWKPEGATGAPAADSGSPSKGMETPDLEVGNIQPAAGAVKIADLYSNREKYNGKKIKVTGKCIKVNPMIMNRNWLHIKDSSTKDRDLTVTTTEVIPLGAVITLEGTIALDRDFGAGYRYDIIMEAAVISN